MRHEPSKLVELTAWEKLCDELEQIVGGSEDIAKLRQTRFNPLDNPHGSRIPTAIARSRSAWNSRATG